MKKGENISENIMYNYDKEQRDNNNKLHGKQYDYYPNGNKSFESNYKHGLKHGKEIEYNKHKLTVFRKHC